MYKQSPSRKILRELARITSPRNLRVTRRRSFTQFVGLSVIASFLLFVSLASRAQDTAQEQAKIASDESGFLGDYYSKLQVDPKNSDLLIYWKTPDILKNTHKFILDPVIVYLLPEAQQRGIDPEQLEKLAQYFTNAVRGELTKSGSYQVVTKPGPGVMVLKLAITNLEPTGGKENAAVKGATTAATMAVAPGVGLVVPRISVGKVSIEGELVDSVSGDVEVAFMSSKSGRRFFSGFKAYQKWGDIEAAFRAWADNFRERLDKAHES
jgi:hypothetical protein